MYIGANIAKVESRGKSHLTMPRPRRLYVQRTNIAKVESRGKSYPIKSHSIKLYRNQYNHFRMAFTYASGATLF